MKSILIHMQKGGVGKTTIAAHIGWFMAERGHRIAVLDMDTQKNLTQTFPSNTGENGLTPTVLSPIRAVDFITSPDNFPPWTDPTPKAKTITVFRSTLELADIRNTDMAENLKANLGAISNYFDHIIIDSGPKVDLLTGACLSATDFLVIPVELQQYSLTELADLLTRIEVIVDTVNPYLRLLAIVPNKFNKMATDQREFMKRLHGEFPNMIYDGAIAHRQPFMSASSHTPPIPVWKHPAKKGDLATQDITPLLEDIATEMETA